MCVMCGRESVELYSCSFMLMCIRCTISYPWRTFHCRSCRALAVRPSSRVCLQRLRLLMAIDILRESNRRSRKTSRLLLKDIASHCCISLLFTDLSALRRSLIFEDILDEQRDTRKHCELLRDYCLNILSLKKMLEDLLSSARQRLTLAQDSADKMNLTRESVRRKASSKIEEGQSLVRDMPSREISFKSSLLETIAWAS